MDGPGEVEKNKKVLNFEDTWDITSEARSRDIPEENCGWAIQTINNFSVLYLFFLCLVPTDLAQSKTVQVLSLSQKKKKIIVIYILQSFTSDLEQSSQQVNTTHPTSF